MAMEQLMKTIENFRFEARTAPLCRFQDAVAACACYFLSIIFFKYYMNTRKAFDLRSIVICHNFLLSALSATLLFGFAVVLFEKSFEFSAWEMICSPTFHEDGRLHLLYYLV